MTHIQRLYNLIAAMGRITRAEIKTATNWPRWRLSWCIGYLVRNGAIRPQNINGRRHYVPC